jgi:hypothetical protein
MPFRTPKVYFADHCRRTTNFVLITERVPFATGAYERAHDKYLDRFLPRPPAHYYLVLMQQLGRMVAAYKTGALGTELERHFPCEPREAPPAKPDDMKMLRYQVREGKTVSHTLLTRVPGCAIPTVVCMYMR